VPNLGLEQVDELLDVFAHTRWPRGNPRVGRAALATGVPRGGSSDDSFVPAVGGRERLGHGAGPFGCGELGRAISKAQVKKGARDHPVGASGAVEAVGRPVGAGDTVALEIASRVFREGEIFTQT